MTLLDQLLAVLLETWDQRYTFELDRDKQELQLRVQGFELTAAAGSAKKILLMFEEAGTKYRVECTVQEAPDVIEELLFPQQ